MGPAESDRLPHGDICRMEYDGISHPILALLKLGTWLLVYSP